MRVLVLVLLSLLLVTIESSLVKYLGLTVSRIDVTVALIVMLSLRAGILEGAIGAFCMGYILDLMSGRPTGLYTFLGVLLFLGSKVAGSVVEIRSLVGFTLFVLGADLAHSVAAVLLSTMASRGGTFTGSAFSAIPLQLLLTGLAAAVLYPIFRRLEIIQDRPGLKELR